MNRFNQFTCLALAVLLVFGLLACDKGETTEIEKVWTMADCVGHTWDSTNYYFQPCDTVMYRDFINDCQWMGDTIPAAIADFYQMGHERNGYFWNLKKLSPKVAQIAWWKTLLLQGDMSELPSEIWTIPNLPSIFLDSMIYLHSLPDLSETNAWLTEVRIVRMPLLDSLPQGMWLLSNLQELVVSLTNLEHLPNWLPRLEALTYLSATENQLVDIPENILNMPKLTEFDFFDNQITALPANFCPNPFEYILSGNRLCNLSDSLKVCMGWDSIFQASQRCE